MNEANQQFPILEIRTRTGTLKIGCHASRVALGIAGDFSFTLFKYRHAFALQVVQ
jgi:hypothetical protein